MDAKVLESQLEYLGGIAVNKIDGMKKRLKQYKKSELIDAIIREKQYGLVDPEHMIEMRSDGAKNAYNELLSLQTDKVNMIALAVQIENINGTFSQQNQQELEKQQETQETTNE